MSDNAIKEIFHKFALSEESIQGQLEEEIEHMSHYCDDLERENNSSGQNINTLKMKMSDISPTILALNVGISAEELSKQLLTASQIIQKQSEIELLNELQRVYDSKELLENSLQELSELASDPDDFSLDIPSLKKRIKYCKNPLERKSLERQLNAAYKELKKKRR